MNQLGTRRIVSSSRLSNNFEAKAEGNASNCAHALTMSLRLGMKCLGSNPQSSAIKTTWKDSTVAYGSFSTVEWQRSTSVLHFEKTS